MPDREKVIKGLECCLGGHCIECPYSERWGFGDDVCVRTLRKDTIELLREQEMGFCPKCHQVVKWTLNRNYCGFCGQAVKWE